MREPATLPNTRGMIIELVHKMAVIKQAKTFDEVVNALTFDGLKEVIHALYNVQGMSMERIAHELGKDYRTINRWIRVLGIKPRPNINPFHLSKLVPYRWMEETKLSVVNGKPVRLTSIYPTSDLSYLVGFAIGDGLDREHDDRAMQHRIRTAQPSLVHN